MTSQNNHSAQFELLEPRTMLSATVVPAERFESSSDIQIHPAESISLDGSLVEQGDTNIYSFSTSAKGYCYLNLQGENGLDTLLEVYVQKNNGTYRRYRVNDNASRNTLDSFIKLKTKPGETYYIVARGSKGTTGDYTLSLTGDPKDDYGNENNTAQNLNFKNGKVSSSGTINYDGDVDVLRIVAPSNGPMTINLQGLNAQLMPEVSISDAAGNELVNSSEVGSTNITINTVAGEVYYLRVSGSNYGYKYKMSLVSPIDDIGDTFETAKTIGINAKGNGKNSGSINWNTDSDVFKATATTTGLMTVDVTARSSRENLDPEVIIYNADGDLIASDDNSGQGNAAQISFYVTAGETYYFRVSSSEANSDGKYALKVFTAAGFVPPAPTPDPIDPVDTEPVLDPAPAANDALPGNQVIAEAVVINGVYTLRVLGTNGNDHIVVSQSGNAITVLSSDATNVLSGAFENILIYGFDGDDVIRVENNVLVGGSIYGGKGNDKLYEAAAASFSVYGEDGDDLIVTLGGGQDRLYGGSGFDSFWLDSNDIVYDASSQENSAGSVHRITEFYQPYTNNPNAVDYVSLEISGQDLRDPTTNSYAKGWKNFSHLPVFSNGAQFNDIDQGSLGDCYYLAVLSSLSDTDPGLIEQMVTPLGDGTYAVRFYNSGQEVYLRIDGDLPVNSSNNLVYARLTPDNEIWVALAEKAYAYYRYGKNSYSSIESGWMSTAYAQVTGGYTTSKITYNSTASSMYNYLLSKLNSGYAVTTGTYSVTDSPWVAGHAYVIKSVQTVGGQMMATIYNPWGIDGRAWDSNSSDGLMNVTIDSILDNCSAVVVSLV